MTVAASDLFADDESIWLRAHGDYDEIAPASQRVARGTDGAFAADSRWTLTSSSATFTSSGVAAGMVVKLTTATRGASALFPPSGMSFVVESVDSETALTLRRPGMAASEGDPPGPAAGADSITYEVVTVRPQIEFVTYRLRQQYQIDENLSRRAYADLYDPREVEEVCCQRVLGYLYKSAWSEDSGDVYKAKMADAFACAREVESRTLVRWGSAGDEQPPNSPFSTRLSR